jgi:hypothetical protein
MWTPVGMTPKDPDAFKVAQGDAKSKVVRDSRGYGVGMPAKGAG